MTLVEVTALLYHDRDMVDNFNHHQRNHQMGLIKFVVRMRTSCHVGRITAITYQGSSV